MPKDIHPNSVRSPQPLPPLQHLQRLAIAPSQRAGSTLTLTPDQQHYLTRVLRLRTGDRFIALDGQGHWWLTSLTDQLNQAEILEAIAVRTELPIPVVLLIAMPKGSGMDDIVRQTTELGVAEIVPIQSDRTLLHPSPQKVERWRRIAQEAAEQSERQIIPTIHDPLSWDAAIRRWSQTGGPCYLCTARGDRPHLLVDLQARLLSRSQIIWSNQWVIAIGPEGGWTDTEVAGAIAAGYQPVSLGQRILRAITAPAVALAIVTSVLETMSSSSESV